LLVGPSADPAGVRGERDAVAALREIIAKGSPFLLQASLGADSVLHDLLEVEKLQLAEAQMVPFGGADQRAMLARAVERGAYALVGRIPFINGKIAHHGLELMVQGDPRLRRPYLVEVARGPAGAPRLAAARELAEFLRAPATQEWLAVYGKGRFDDQPLFFPVTVPAAAAP
jgi:tungstate transport system substrate-binding protein